MNKVKKFDTLTELNIFLENYYIVPISISTVTDIYYDGLRYITHPKFVLLYKEELK